MTDINQPGNNQFIDANPDSKNLVEIIIEGLRKRKAQDIVVLDVSELTTLTDYFVICSGNSDTQIKAIADSVEEELLEQTGEKAWKKEGLQARSWIILDFINTVVHIMSKEKREFYSIERMWNDAKITYIENED
ncbi:MAG: ribosome silencing factor [Balneola sp.]|nr:MAG: ribosome silencing factor [Balneola sp.]